MVEFSRYLLNGIGNGAVYASMALALVLIYRTTGLLNLAQGEMALFSAYLTWAFTAEGVEFGIPSWVPGDLESIQVLPGGLPIGVAIALSVVLSMGMGAALIEVSLIRPVTKPGKSPLDVLIVMLGLFLGLNAVAQLIFSEDAETMAKPWPSAASPGSPTGSNRFWSLGDVRLFSSTMALLVMLAVVCLFLFVLFQWTKVGLKLRAVASNAASSQLVGIRSGSMLMLGWALSAGLGALAASMVAAERGSVNPGLMAVVLVYSFSAAALGGFDSAVGAVVGGMIVAIAEALATGYTDTSVEIGGVELSLAFLDGIELVVPFAIILLVLLIRPTGLFGKRVVERV